MPLPRSVSLDSAFAQLCVARRNKAFAQRCSSQQYAALLLPHVALPNQTVPMPCAARRNEAFAPCRPTLLCLCLAWRNCAVPLRGQTVPYPTKPCLCTTKRYFTQRSFAFARLDGTLPNTAFARPDVTIRCRCYAIRRFALPCCAFAGPDSTPRDVAFAEHCCAEINGTLPCPCTTLPCIAFAVLDGNVQYPAPALPDSTLLGCAFAMHSETKLHLCSSLLFTAAPLLHRTKRDNAVP